MEPTDSEYPAADAATSKSEFTGKTLAQCVVARTINDTGSQIFNPFLPIIAAGLKTSEVALGSFVSLRSIMGLMSPLFGTLGDRYGFRLTMRWGLAGASVGAALVGLSQALWVTALGMMIWGIGIAAFIPTLQAYLSSQLPYERRARGIGIVEYAWAFAGIFGLLFMGWLIQTTGSWRAPFYVLSAGMALMAVVVGRFPRAEHRQATSSQPRHAVGRPPVANMGRAIKLIGFFRLGPNSKSAYANMMGSALFFFAAMQLLIAHGAWLEKEYGIQPLHLGIVAMVLGFSDLLGSGLVSLFADRLGKKTSVLLGCGAGLFGCLLMPWLNTSLILAIVGLAIARGSFEFAIVANIALLSEQVPDQRGKVMTLGSACLLIGSTVAGTSGPWLYTTLGVSGLTMVSAGATLVGMLIIGWRVNDSRPFTPAQEPKGGIEKTRRSDKSGSAELRDNEESI